MTTIKTIKKSECNCDNGEVRGTVKIEYCQSCNWEECCQSEECDSTEGLSDSGYCEECSFNRSFSRIDFAD